MQLWLQRVREVESKTGCLYTAGSFEFDDCEGPLRDLLLEHVLHWRASLRRAVDQAISAGHLRDDTDPDQLVFELDGLFVSLMREARFLRDPLASDRAQRAYERIIHSFTP